MKQWNRTVSRFLFLLRVVLSTEVLLRWNASRQNRVGPVKAETGVETGE